MPIVEEKFWVVKCECGAYLDTTGADGIEIWNSKTKAKTALKDNGYWEIEEGSGHILCDGCSWEKSHKKDHFYDYDIPEYDLPY